MKKGCEALADLVGLGDKDKPDNENLQDIEQAKELVENSLKAETLYLALNSVVKRLKFYLNVHQF